MECSRVEMLKKIQCSNFAAYDMLCILIPIRTIKRHSECFRHLLRKPRN